MVPVATLLGAQHYKASTGFSSPNTYRTTNFATLAKINKSEKKSPIIINVCIHRRTVWKTGSYAKYVILLKYRDYYYYYCVKLKYIVGIYLSFSYDIMKLYRMWNVIVSTYDCNSSVHLFFLLFQHIRGKEIIKQKIP